MKFDVCLGEEAVGTAWVKKAGLYYHIRCSCRLTGQVRYKILATGGSGEADLGLCVPYADGYGLEVRLPIKRVGDGKLKFRAVPKHQQLQGQFIPIRAEEPFRYIQGLKDAFLAKKNGQEGVLIPNQNSSSSPTGQWSEPRTSE